MIAIEKALLSSYIDARHKKDAHFMLFYSDLLKKQYNIDTTQDIEMIKKFKEIIAV